MTSGLLSWWQWGMIFLVIVTISAVEHAVRTNRGAASTRFKRRRYDRSRVDRIRGSVRTLAFEWQRLPGRLMQPDIEMRMGTIRDLRKHIEAMQSAADDFIDDDDWGSLLKEISEQATAILMLSDPSGGRRLNMPMDEIAAHKKTFDDAVAQFLDATGKYPLPPFKEKTK